MPQNKAIKNHIKLRLHVVKVFIYYMQDAYYASVCLDSSAR